MDLLLGWAVDMGAFLSDRAMELVRSFVRPSGRLADRTTTFYFVPQDGYKPFFTNISFSKRKNELVQKAAV
jgi:hypothetical protein